MGIGEAAITHTKGRTIITLQSNYSDFALDLNVFILTKLTSWLPTFSTQPDHSWPHLKGLELADSEFLTSRPVDIIIGADYYGSLIQSDIRSYSPNSPIAQLTRFGWIVLGPVENTPSNIAVTHHVAMEKHEVDIREVLTKFWEQEEVPIDSRHQLTPAEQACEAHFSSTHSRDSSGRYTVRIPLCDSSTQLGDSLSIAKHCLQRLQHRLSRDSTYSSLYCDFLKEYETLNHMRRSSFDSSQGFTPYYLPHHGVFKADSSTTKLRVVFNGSSPTHSGRSLNDIMHTGAKMQLDIADVLLWARRHRYIFSTDITKMFRQINVHHDDWDLQRILWVDEQFNITPFSLTTVTYGTRAAPYLAVRTMLQLAQDEGSRFPLAIDPLTKGRYVDDIFGGADSIDSLIEISQQVTQMCKAGGFPLAKWQSNAQELLALTSSSITQDETHTFDDCSTKILGLLWYPLSDVFKFNSKPPHSGSKLTKRIILSETAQLFDPLGFLAPLIIKAKLLFQELWLDKLNWDDRVSPSISHKWTQFRNELTSINEITIPRWLLLSNNSTVEIHGFSDASQLAMAAVVYLKVISPEIGTKISIVCSKTKVAPLKRLTIPRLELTAALLLAKLVKYVQQTLELSHVPVFLWTDSSVTLTWIQTHPSRWKDFVRNRVSAIQDLTPHCTWRFVPGKQNPADCASRGLTVSQLKKHQLWWTGPPWLLKPLNHWPSQVLAEDSLMHTEQRPGLLLNVVTLNGNYQWDLIARYSSLTRLLRITAICFRILSRLKRLPHSSLSYPLNTHDIEITRIFWIKATQAAFFSHELKVLHSNSTLPKTHPFTRLTAFLDAQGVIRVGGRLSRITLDPEAKHPAILPRRSLFSNLLIADAHFRTLHGGTQLTLNYLRNSYWIIGGRAPVRSFILRCVRCARQRGVRAQQLMGQLPPSRVTPSRPFNSTGVDYAGPLQIKAWRGRGAKCHKGWLCVFVCMVTSAVHLEVVCDNSTEGFVAAFRRFTGRRGICSTLFSDCGTNFLGADTLLKRLFTQGTHEYAHLSNIFAHDGTTWRFNPPAAPHMRGKWEAAVKSLKFHLHRVIGETLLTLEELTTLLVQIEAVLNSRPLEPLSEDPDDLSVLTPGHFLIGHALNTLPEPSLGDLACSRLNRWQLIQQKFQNFWSIWSSQYTQRLQSISKWYHPSNSINVGSLVLITDERFPPTRWPLARITQLHPGKDGLTRVVTLKTATTTLTRPITKLALLPVTTQEDNSMES